MPSRPPWPFLAAIILVTLNLLVVSAQNAVRYNLCSNNGTDTVSLNSTSGQILIRSPNYGPGRTYSNNQHCSLVFQTEAEPLILSFTPEDFVLEFDNFCSFDYVCLNGVRICQGWMYQRLQYIVPEYSTFTFFFKTDTTGQRPGFLITLSVELAGNQTIQEAKGGYGIDNLQYTPVTYYPGYPYTDRCPSPPDEIQDSNQTTTEEPDQFGAEVYTFCQQSSTIVNINSNSTPVLIHSPNFGAGFYPNNINCGLVLQSGIEPLILTFTLKHFRVESNLPCNFDSLCLNKAQYCGNLPTGYISRSVLPENSRLTLVFQTDSTVTSSGFEIRVTVERADINQTVDEEWGSWSGTHEHNFETVVYYHGMSYSDACALLQPTTTPPPQTTTNDTPTQFPGFTTATTSLPNNTPNDHFTEHPDTSTSIPVITTTIRRPDVYTLCESSPSIEVNVLASSPAFRIYSPNFGRGNYSDNQNCSLIVKSGSEPLILSLSYIIFGLELETGSCGYDSLCVFGVKFCGNWLRGRTHHYILPPSQSFTLAFKTDGSVTSIGFEIHVAVEFATSQTIEEIYGGVGSSEANVLRTTVSYSPDYWYTDRCAASSQTTTDYPTTYPTQVTTGTSAYYFCGGATYTYLYLGPFTRNIIIRSPNYGSGQYRDNQYCNFVLATIQSPLLLRLNYTSFSLEYQEQSGFDSLCVHGVKYCGTWPTGRSFQYFLPAYSIFTLIFKTDQSVTSSGFEILMSSELATSQTIQEATGGYGSNQSRVTYTTVTYGPGFSYTDRCVNQPSPTPAYSTPSTPFIENTTPVPDVYYFCQTNVPIVLRPYSPDLLIRSPNYRPGPYGDIQNCSIVLVTGQSPLLLRLNYRYFYLWDLRNCGNYSLCVHGVKLCGSWPIGESFEYFLPAYSNFTIIFTPNVVADSWVEILVSGELATNQTIREATGGYGHYEAGVTYTTVRYGPGYNYTDRCVNQSPSTPSPTPGSLISDETTSQPPVTMPDYFTGVPDVYYFCQTYFPIYLGPYSPNFRIRSPNYGSGQYRDNQNCSIVLVTGESPLLLRLNYAAFSLESNPNCFYDSLCVHGVKYCGSWPTGRLFEYFVPAYSNFTLIFKTDHSVTSSGFEISVSKELATNQTIQEARGGYGSSLSSLNYTTVTYGPGFNYTDRCVNQPPVTPPNTTPAPLYTNIFTTSSPTEPAVYYFCNGTNHIYLIGNSIDIRIRSPRYGSGQYGNNEYCTVYLITWTSPLILRLNYRYFSLESQQTCNYDSLCVHGVKYCGSWPTGRVFQYILPAYSYFTLIFKTDGSVIDSGFEISVSKELATNQAIQEATGGYGSSLSSLRYTTVTYGPGFNYTDRCVEEIQTTTPDTYSNDTTTEYPTSEHNEYYMCDTAIPYILPGSSSILIRNRRGEPGQCSFTLASLWSPVLLRLNYTFFSLWEDTNCSYDSLCVNGVTFCGSWPGGRSFEYFLPAYSNFTIIFTLNDIVPDSWFELLVSSELATNQTIQEATGGNGSYEGGVNYTTVTYGPWFNYTDRCVNQSPSTPSPTPASLYSDDTTFQPPVSTPDYFTGNVYYFCDYFSYNQRTLYIDANTRPFRIRSQFYNYNSYQDNTLCPVTLSSDREPLLISFRYRDMRLEQCHTCSCDYVCSNGVKLCGSWLIGQTLQYFLPENNDFTLTFRTDASVVNYGFEIEVTVEQATNQTIRQATFAQGYSNEILYYTNATYPLDYQYTDRCATNSAPTTSYPWPPTVTNNPSTSGPVCLNNVDEIEAAIDQAINTLQRARSMLRIN